MEENTQHYQHTILYYFKKGKNATEMQKKVCAVYGERAGTDRTCQSGLRSFVLEIPWGTMFHGQVDQLRERRAFGMMAEETL